MSVTVHLDEKIEQRVLEESHRSGESIESTVNRLLASAFAPRWDAHEPSAEDSWLDPKASQADAKPKRFVVKPFDTGLTTEQWRKWENQNIWDVLDEAERMQVP